MHTLHQKRCAWHNSLAIRRLPNLAMGLGGVCTLSEIKGCVRFYPLFHTPPNPIHPLIGNKRVDKNLTGVYSPARS
jgi:hypothetical protein